jgi:hypothetical protein
MAQVTNAHAIREIELILYSGNPHYEARAWTVAGVQCRRDRHRYTGEGYAFSIEVLQLRFSDRAQSAWEAVIVTERWATGMPETAIRGNKWMKLISGRSPELRSWIRRHRPTGVPQLMDAESPAGPVLDFP